MAVPKDHPLTEHFPKTGMPYPLADLRLCRNEKFITCRQGRRMYDVAMSETRSAGFVPDILIECSSTESVNAMVCHGMGLAFVPSTTVELCSADQRPQYYRLRPDGLIRRFGLIYRSGKNISLEEDRFLTLARKLAQEEKPLKPIISP